MGSIGMMYSKNQPTESNALTGGVQDMAWITVITRIELNEGGKTGI